MKKQNFISWLTIISITSITLAGCNSGSEGTPNINNNLNNGSNEAIVTPITLDKISINSNKSSVAMGESLTLHATAYYSDNSHKTVTDLVRWNVEGESNIAIDTLTGEVTTLAEGTAVVTASLDGVESGPFNVDVTAPELTDIALITKEKSLPIGISTKLETWGHFTDDQWRRIANGIQWKTTAEDVLTIDDEGNVKALSEGSAKIVAVVDHLNSHPITIEVTKAELTAIDITPAEVSMPLGTAQALVAMGTFTSGKTVDITQDVEWLQVRSDVARIENGKMIAIKIGSETISAKKGDIQSQPVEVKVTDAVISHLQLTPVNATLAKGTTLEFNAKSIYTDGTEKDVTDSVEWKSDNYDVLTFVDNKATGHQQAKVQVFATLPSGEKAAVNVTVTNAALSQIDITPTSIELGKEQVGQFRAIGKYTDGSEADITAQVSWSSSNSNNVSMMQNGLLNGLEVGTSTITARLQGIYQTATVNVEEQLETQDSIAMCGGRIDDDSRTTAQGNCLKVASDKFGNLFSGAPSITLLQGLGYKLVKNSEKPQANTKSYNDVKIEKEGYGPAGEAFGLFNNDGLTGQNEQWCNELSAKNFAGRNNWRRATRAELIGLYTKVGGSLWDGDNDDGYDSKGLGWPVLSVYWSALNMDLVPTEGYYDIVNMNVGRSFLIQHGKDPAYPSCIAPVAR
ncbi:Ig-like domain-containing protein [Vibrio mimicus]